MKLSPEYRWQIYKSEFLRANRCTDQEFHDAYVAFMEGLPSIADYRKFARRYHITIHPEPRLPVNMEVILSVNIAALKVMAQTYAESTAAIEDILGSVPNA